MARLIILPFRVHPSVPDIPGVIVPIGPIFPQEGATTLQDVRDWFQRYLGRQPADDAEAIGYGRIGLPRASVELEIATSQEALNYLEAHGITPTPKPPPVTPPPAGGTYSGGFTTWDVQVGNLIANAIARRLGIDVPPLAWIVFAAQAHHEDAGGDVNQSEGALYNNPLNLSDAGGSIVWPGQTGRYLGQFARFDSIEDGAEACAANYLGSYYPNVIEAFRQGDPLSIAAAIQASPWDADHYGGNLVTEVQSHLA